MISLKGVFRRVKEGYEDSDDYIAITQGIYRGLLLSNNLFFIPIWITFIDVNKNKMYMNVIYLPVKLTEE